MIHIVSWLWGSRYPDFYLKRLQAGVQSNLRCEHVLHAVTEADRGINLPRYVRRHDIPDEVKKLIWEPGCLSRLVMFSSAWQRKAGIDIGDLVVSMDIDAIVTNNLDSLFGSNKCNGSLTIMQGFNTTNPCPFNGSLWAFEAGRHEDVWTDFSLTRYLELGVPFHSFPDDQGWLHYKFPVAGAYMTADGVYAFAKVGWPQGKGLPTGARFIAFPGWRDPKNYVDVDWVKKYWADVQI